MQALEYTSHLLVAEAVGEYLHVRAHTPSQISHTPSQTSDGPSQTSDPPSQIEPVMYLGLDLGAGTGLACEPVKSAVAHTLKVQGLGLEPGHTVKGQGLGSGESNYDWGDMVGMLGVDLSPKMQQKVQNQGLWLADYTDFPPLLH